MDDKENKSIMNLEAITRKGADPGFFREVWQQMRLVYYLLRDPEVPFYLKLLPFSAVVYLLWPVDLLTDLVPVLGQLDDVTALLVSSKVFIELAPQHLVTRHMDKIRAADGFSAEQEVDEKIIIDPQPDFTASKKDQATS